MILCLGTTQTESHPLASCTAFCTCTLALSPPPHFSDIFILVLKERSDRHYGRKRQQHAHRSALRLYRSQALRAIPGNEVCARPILKVCVYIFARSRAGKPGNEISNLKTIV